MEHSIYNDLLKTTIKVDETLSNNTSIMIENLESGNFESHYFNQKELSDFIDLLLWVHSKKNKNK